MSVVNGVGAGMEDERDPTLEEAIAALNAATPVEIDRPPRQVTVVYRYANGIFTATSPEIRSLRATGRNRAEVQAAAREDLGGFLDPAVKVVEYFATSEPGTCTATTGRGWVKTLPLDGIFVVTSSGTARTFVSSPRTTMRQVQTS